MEEAHTFVKRYKKIQKITMQLLFAVRYLNIAREGGNGLGLVLSSQRPSDYPMVLFNAILSPSKDTVHRFAPDNSRLLRESFLRYLLTRFC